MPCTTIGKSDLQKIGPTIEIFIAPSQMLRNELEKQNKIIPKPIKKAFLIDTGASSTVMKSGIASDLGLTAKGQISIQTTSSNDFKCYTYDVDILLPNHIVFKNILVCEAPLEGQNIEGLLGRDI